MLLLSWELGVLYQVLTLLVALRVSEEALCGFDILDALRTLYALVPFFGFFFATVTA